MTKRGNQILLTGFGPFGKVSDNPSGRVVARVADRLRAVVVSGDTALELESKVLPVRPSVIEEIGLSRVGTLISIGVDAQADTGAIRVETGCRNIYIDPENHRAVAIDPTHPNHHALRGGPLPPGITEPRHGFAVRLGDPQSAGTYVCNDTFYRACRNGTIAYFIHIPLTDPTADEALCAALASVASHILTFRRRVFGFWHRD